MMKIRPFRPTESEYAALLQLRNLTQPDSPSSVAIWQYVDQTRDPQTLFARFVVEKAGQRIGYGQYEETALKNGSFRFAIHLHPAYQGGSLAARLYSHILAAIQSHRPMRLITQIRENETMKLHWLRQNGFRQGKRYPVSRLNVARFDPAPFAPYLEKVAAAGIQIISLAELAPQDPAWQRQVYELDFVLMSDVPLQETYVKRPFSQFVKDEFQHPNFFPEGWFVARDGRQYIGITALVKQGGQTQSLATALTGVIRPYRRQGIAIALKTTSIVYAQTCGAQTILTDNESHNPMYRINRRLGFQPQPARLDFENQC